ncbi:hypothetical protein THRCLA_00685 [Thraustotheca clavata]|uniref:Uncharacterized protein n=1 Tax=Thraustotheca clavata TaxID=74557 RepID=A0A1W0AAH2_9STRA|nr:hypothetical protein THRCLA_00685 [Thraustotheca clavata]
MISAISGNGDDLLVGTALGEVFLVNYASSSELKEAVDLLDCTEWKYTVSLEAITCIEIHGKEAVVGDAKGTVVVLNIVSGMELRRYKMEGAVVAATWHNEVFVVGDHVGNFYGIDNFCLRWKKRMDLGNSSVNVRCVSSVQLRDAENQLCSYVAMGLGGQELLLTHLGNVVLRIATPTVITTICHFIHNQTPRIFCGGSNGSLYEIVGVGTGSSFNLILEEKDKISYPISSLHIVKESLIITGNECKVVNAVNLTNWKATEVPLPQSPATIIPLHTSSNVLVLFNDRNTLFDCPIPWA